MYTSCVVVSFSLKDLNNYYILLIKIYLFASSKYIFVFTSSTFVLFSYQSVVHRCTGPSCYVHSWGRTPSNATARTVFPWKITQAHSNFKFSKWHRCWQRAPVGITILHRGQSRRTSRYTRCWRKQIRIGICISWIFSCTHIEDAIEDAAMRLT